MILSDWRSSFYVTHLAKDVGQMKQFVRFLYPYISILYPYPYIPIHFFIIISLELRNLKEILFRNVSILVLAGIIVRVSPWA